MIIRGNILALESGAWLNADFIARGGFFLTLSLYFPTYPFPDFFIIIINDNLVY